MGKSQRVKGANGEREVANMFKEAGLPARRGLRQWQDASGEPDVVVDAFPWLWSEVKRGARTNPHAAFQQAKEAAGSHRVPVAICRNDREETRVTMSWDFFIRLLREAYPTKFTTLELPNVKDDLSRDSNENQMGSTSVRPDDTGGTSRSSTAEQEST